MEPSSYSLPIGLFDSGIGGLTVLKSMEELMPNEDYLYLGDTARLPYGTKGQKTICRYAKQAASLLIQKKIKLLVVACNTATGAALPELQKTFPSIPIIGVIEPSAREASEVSISGRILVVATPATIQADSYRKTILDYRPEARVTSLACPLFVPLVEEGWFDGPIVTSIIKKYFDPILSAEPRPDCIVLGCTHYPLLINAIRYVVSPEAPIVSSSTTTAKAVFQYLAQRDAFHPESSTRKGSSLFLTTDDVQKFISVGNLFLSRPINSSNVELANLS